jgi:hypothetical protein
LPATQMIVAELLGDVQLELASEHSNVRVAGLPWIAASRYSSLPALMPLMIKPDSTPYSLRAVTSLRVAPSGSGPFAVFRHVSRMIPSVRRRA